MNGRVASHLLIVIHLMNNAFGRCGADFVVYGVVSGCCREPGTGFLPAVRGRPRQYLREIRPAPRIAQEFLARATVADDHASSSVVSGQVA